MSFDVEKDPRLRELMMHDAIVCATMHAGGTVVDALVALSEARRGLLGELAELQGQVGRRYKLPDGAILVHRPPDDVLPLTDLSQVSWYQEPDPARSRSTIKLMGITYRQEPGEDEPGTPFHLDARLDPRQCTCSGGVRLYGRHDLGCALSKETGGRL
jgi:hypothetical protein